jgi:hypothetical protein
MVAHFCHPSYSGEVNIGESQSRPAWVKKQDHTSKITRAKRAGGMVQAAEHLHSKCEILNFKPQYHQNK